MSGEMPESCRPAPCQVCEVLGSVGSIPLASPAAALWRGRKERGERSGPTQPSHRCEGAKGASHD